MRTDGQTGMTRLIFLSCKANARVNLAKTGHGPHSSTLVCICVVLLLFLLFCVLLVCKCVLPPGDNPIAVNKQIIINIMTSPQPLPKRVHHRVISSASFFSFQYPLVSSRTSSSCLHLFPRLPVTFIVPSIFPSVTYFITQFLRKRYSVSYTDYDGAYNITWKCFDINVEKKIDTRLKRVKGKDFRNCIT